MDAAALRIDYPQELPISARRDDIAAALREHKAIVVCGATGSGKTTQLPKICLEAGRGVGGLVGHTQPRRIAARAVAERLATELGVALGGAVGYQVRFTDARRSGSRVKIMTDGILLNEIRADRRLERYDTLIIDEAHERSLNIDFLLGYLSRVLARRDDLKVVVTSATIDPERFARHFGGAPIIEVEGRTYPVEIRYAPPAPGEPLVEAVVSACRELASLDVEPLGGGTHRDVLVFLPGERWIRDAEAALRRDGPADFEIVPLYARLAAQRQQRIFEPGPRPRIVLATNVAETSLTVPRIRFVVDSGLARIARYAARHRVQGLGVEPVAKASAIQRAGRCGRIAPGVCVRLYTEEDFAQRPDFTEPEILRTNLSGVILRLEALRLGHVADFPFLDAPPGKSVNDAYRLLHVLGAMDADRRLTPEGAIMGRLPLDPRLARLLLAGNSLRCLQQSLVVAAALSVVDPREHPPEALEAARERHAKFADPRSDFSTYLVLWKAYREARGPKRGFRAWCKDNYLSWARLEEWDDVHGQLAELVAQLGWRVGRERAGDARALHRAVLASFVDLIGEKGDRGVYHGMHGAKAYLFPGSPVASRQPRWVVAAEHLATERSYLRTIAQINPRWVLDAAPHLVKRDYRDPQWDAAGGRVTAREVASVFGLVLTTDRRVDYGPIAPAEARRLFIAEALVGDDLGADFAFLEKNRAAKREVLEWEGRLRSRDLYVGDRALDAFYSARLPAHVRDRESLARWCGDSTRAASLVAAADDLATRPLAAIDPRRYPKTFEAAGQSFALVYRYEPGDPHDGVTLRLPAAFLGAVRREQLDWAVPGWLEAKTLALLRTLPKEWRRKLVPLPDTAAALAPSLERRRGQHEFTSAVCEALIEARGIGVPADALARDALAPHFDVHVDVLDDSGRVIGGGRDIRKLQRRFANARVGIAAEAAPTGRIAAEAAPTGRIAAEAAPTGRIAAEGASTGGIAAEGASTGAAGGARGRWMRAGVRRWDFGALPERVAVEHGGGRYELYPALVEDETRVDLALLAPGPAAVERHRRGVRRLLVTSLPQQAALVRSRVLGDRQLVLGFHGLATAEQIVDDVLTAAADETFALEPPIRDAAAFDRALADGRAAFVPKAERLLGVAASVAACHREIRRRLRERQSAAPDAAAADIEAQLHELTAPRFLTSTPAEWRGELPRYLAAALARTQKLAHPKDAAHRAQIELAWRRYRDWRAALPPGWPEPPAVTRYRWLVEELRVSLFAQSLGTVAPVSAKRLEEAWRQALAAS